MSTRKSRLISDVGDALLDAAREAFVADGIEGLSLRRVAERAGCTTMAVYTRFGAKDGLVAALFDEGFEQLKLAQAEVAVDLDPAARVLGLCHAYRSTAHAFPHHYALMLGSASGSFEPSEESRAKSLATLNTLINAVLACQPPGRGRQLRASTLAHRLFAFCHGWVSLEQIGFLQGSAASQDKAFDDALKVLLVN
jgi:AcrR family transcriptional regulator